MELHKFKPGQSVEFVASDLHLKPLGMFKIVRVMPSERGVTIALAWSSVRIVSLRAN